MIRLLLLTAVLVAAVAVLAAVTVPPARRALSPSPPDDGTIPGILHIHTARSDGQGTPDEIADAAARAGAKFIVFTDHGDATRTPDAPVYRSGVLSLDGVEISTTGGHYLAVDMPAAPYPLGGEARDVVDDVRRLGGFGIVAHPDSPKLDLRWREWAAPFDAIEWINPDTSWRVRAQGPGWRSRFSLIEALIDYPFRPGETIARLLVGTGSAISRWESLAKRRRVVGLAGVDAHAKLALRSSEAGDSRTSLPLPSYDASFRTLSLHVRPERPFSGDALADAAILMRSIRAGHLYTAIDGVASPAAFEFTATNSHGTVSEGNELGVGGPVTLRVRSNAPPVFTTTIWKDSSVLTTGRHDQDFTIQTSDAPAVYRVEIRAASSDGIAWVTSNPIYVRAAEAGADPPPRPPATAAVPLFDGRTAPAWHVEHDSASLAELDVAPTVDRAELRLRYGLGGGSLAGQFAALVVDTPGGVARSDRVAFTVRAEHPMRISVQLRAPGADAAGERWQRSIYVDGVNRERKVYFDDLTPTGATDSRSPPLEQIRSILFVVDTTNTKPGSSGRLWINAAALER
jgi:hypothetical protein